MTTATEEKRSYIKGNAVLPTQIQLTNAEFPVGTSRGEPNVWLEPLSQMQLGDARSFVMEGEEDGADVKATVRKIRAAAVELGFSSKIVTEQGTAKGKTVCKITFGLKTAQVRKPKNTYGEY